MIGRADHDRVDVAVGQQLSIVAVRRSRRRTACRSALLYCPLMSVLASSTRLLSRSHTAMMRADVVLPDARQVVAAGDAAGADRADVDAVARRRRAEDRRRHDRRKPGDDRRGDDALTGRRQEPRRVVLLRVSAILRSPCV